MLLAEFTQTDIEKKLANHIAARYEHTDQSKSLCAEGTRVGLLAEIRLRKSTAIQCQVM
jgi:hypothetical protein